MEIPRLVQDWQSYGQGEDGGPLTVLILYRNVAAAAKAAALVNRLAERFGSEFDVETSLWSFDVLGLPEVAEFAAERASQADLVLVSAGAEQELPAHVSNCLSDGMSKRENRNTAFVALLDQSGEHLTHSPICADLKKLCRLDGDTFFCTRDVPLDSCHLTPERVEHRATAKSSVLDDIMHRPLREPKWSSRL